MTTYKQYTNLTNIRYIIRHSPFKPEVEQKPHRKHYPHILHRSRSLNSALQQKLMLILKKTCRRYTIFVILRSGLLNIKMHILLNDREEYRVHTRILLHSSRILPNSTQDASHEEITQVSRRSCTPGRSGNNVRGLRMRRCLCRRNCQLILLVLGSGRRNCQRVESQRLRRDGATEELRRSAR